MIAEKSLLITSTILDSFAWYKSAPPGHWKEKATEDFKNALNRIYTPMNEDAKRGVDFENGLYRSLYLDRDTFIERHGKQCAKFFDECAGKTQQAKLQKTIEVDGQNYKLYGKADIFSPEKIIDIKTCSNWRGPEKYLDKSQHLLYITASNIPSFEYLVAVGDSIKDSVTEKMSWVVDCVIPIDASMSVEEASNKLADRIREFVGFLSDNKAYMDAYISVFS